MVEPSTESSDASPSLLRRLLVWGGSLVGGLAVLVLVVALLLPRFFTAEELKGYVVPPLEEATGRQVEIDDIGLRVLPTPAIWVSGFRLANAEGYGPAPAVEAQALNVDLALWPLFVGTIRPTAVALEKPVVRYEVAEGGATNFDDFGGPADTTVAEEPGPPLGGIPVSNFRISGARLDYRNRATGQFVRLDFGAQLDALPEGAALTSGGTVDVHSARAVLPGGGTDTLLVRDATVTYEVRMVPADGHVTLRSLQVETAPLTLTTAGTASGLNERPVLDLTMQTGSTDLAEIAAFVPAAAIEGLNPQGTLDLEATVTGPLSDTLDGGSGLSVSASGQLKGGGLDYEGTALIRDLSATLSLSLDTAAVRSIEGTLLQKPLKGQVLVHNLGDRPQVNGHLAGAADLSVLSALAEGGEKTASVRGNADYDVRFAGPATNPTALRPTGEVQLADVRYPTATLRHPVEVPRAVLQLTGTGLSMARTPLRSGSQSVSLQTTLQNLFPISKGLAETNPALTVAFTLTSDRLDLVELYPEADTADVYYSQLFAAHLAGGAVKGQSPDALATALYGGIELPAYAVEGRVEIGTLLNPPQRYDSLAVDVRLKNRRLALRNLTASTYGGQLAGTLTLDQRGASEASAPTGAVLLASTARGRGALSTGSVPPPSTLTYDLELREGNAGAVLSDWTAVGRLVTGTLTLDIEGETPLTEGLLPQTSALTAIGQSRVADGSLSLDLGPAKALAEKLGLPVSSLKTFERFGGTFQVRDGQLQMKTWTLQRDRFGGEVDGALGLDGALNLQMTLNLPLSTLQESQIPDRIGGGDGQLGRVLKKLVGGETTDETVPVTVSIGGTMRNPTVQVVNQEAIVSRIRSLAKEAGLELLRGLFKSGGGGR